MLPSPVAPAVRDPRRMMRPGLEDMAGGFDASDLMNKPAIRQEETRNQANMVSAPYEQANEMAFSKNNPMNAVSQSRSLCQNIFLSFYIPAISSEPSPLLLGSLNLRSIKSCNCALPGSCETAFIGLFLLKAISFAFSYGALTILA